MLGVLAVVVVVVTGARYRNDRTLQYYYYRTETKYSPKTCRLLPRKAMVVSGRSKISHETKKVGPGRARVKIFLSRSTLVIHDK